MAALGAIGETGHYVIDSPGPLAMPITNSAENTQGCKEYKIDGTAEISGVAAPYHMVMLMDRNNRQIAKTTQANSSGYFKFEGLNNSAEYYCVMMMDEGDTGSYNLKALDRITAI